MHFAAHPLPSSRANMSAAFFPYFRNSPSGVEPDEDGNLTTYRYPTLLAELFLWMIGEVTSPSHLVPLLKFFVLPA